MQNILYQHFHALPSLSRTWWSINVLYFYLDVFCIWVHLCTNTLLFPGILKWGTSRHCIYVLTVDTDKCLLLRMDCLVSLLLRLSLYCSRLGNWGCAKHFKVKQPLYLGDSLPCCLYNCIVVKVWFPFPFFLLSFLPSLSLCFFFSVILVFEPMASLMVGEYSITESYFYPRLFSSIFP